MRKPFDGEFTLTQGFGENPADYAKFGMKGHNGLDYGLPKDTPVLAPHFGKVIEASSDPTGYGNYLKIENDKEGSVLAHLNSFDVKVGDSVTEGQIVAHSGNSGNSTGPHLHWGYYLFPRNRQNGYAGFINQLPLVGQESVDTQRIIDELRTTRDNNWNLYQGELAKNNELNQTITGLQTQIQNLRDAFDLQTKADANTGTQLLDAQHEVNYWKNIVTGVAKNLSIEPTKRALLDFEIETAIKTLQSSHNEVVKQIQPVIDGLAEAALTKKIVPPSLWDRIRAFFGI